MTVTVEAGAITQNVIKAVDAAGALFSVDPASKQASSIGGNVSENAGGPSAFEYGTTWTTCSGGAWSPHGRDHQRGTREPSPPQDPARRNGRVRGQGHQRRRAQRHPPARRRDPPARPGQGRDQQGPGRPARHAEGRRGRHHHRGLLHHPSQAQVQARHGAGILRPLHAPRRRGGARAGGPAQPHPSGRRLRPSVRPGRIQRQVRAGHRVQAQVPEV